MKLFSINPGSDGVGIKPKFFDSLSDGHFSSVFENDEKVSTSIVPLFLSCSPIAILFRVTFGVVSAFNSHFRRRAQSHVVKKNLKGKPPFVRHFNASGAVVFESRISRVVATSNDLSPDVIFRHVMDSCASFFVQFVAKTSTTLAVARRKCGVLNQAFITAFASAEPHLVFVTVRSSSQNGPTAILGASDINDFFWWPTHIEQDALYSKLNQGK